MSTKKDKFIRVSQETKDKILDKAKKGETYDDYIKRLLEKDK